MRYGAKERENRYGETRVINVSERYVLDIPDVPYPPEKKNQLLWKNREPKRKEE